jgi:hypothetical protein
MPGAYPTPADIRKIILHQNFDKFFEVKILAEIFFFQNYIVLVQVSGLLPAEWVSYANIHRVYLIPKPEIVLQMEI